jgi:hypothetical protein
VFWSERPLQKFYKRESLAAVKKQLQMTEERLQSQALEEFRTVLEMLQVLSSDRKVPRDALREMLGLPPESSTHEEEEESRELAVKKGSAVKQRQRVKEEPESQKAVDPPREEKKARKKPGPKPRISEMDKHPPIGKEKVSKEKGKKVKLGEARNDPRNLDEVSEERETPTRKERETPMREERETPIRKDRETPMREEKETPIRKERETPIRKERETPMREEKETPMRKERETPTRKPFPFSESLRRNQLLSYFWKAFPVTDMNFGGGAFLPEELSSTDETSDEYDDF